MDKAKSFLPLIIGGIVAITLFILTRKKSNSVDKSAIPEKAREAKLAKSIFKNSEDDKESITE